MKLLMVSIISGMTVLLSSAADGQDLGYNLAAAAIGAVVPTDIGGRILVVDIQSFERANSVFAQLRDDPSRLAQALGRPLRTDSAYASLQCERAPCYYTGEPYVVRVHSASVMPEEAVLQIWVMYNEGESNKRFLGGQRYSVRVGLRQGKWVATSRSVSAVM